jgi:phosphate:Na+ symporter
MIAAALTWAAHSSVATVLLFMSVAYSHFVTPYAALALVLGANLGSAINPVLEAGRRDDLATYRLPVGNLLNRVVGILLVLPFLRPISDALGRLQPDASRMTAEFHIAFNVAMALVFIGLLDPLATLSEAQSIQRPLRAALSRRKISRSTITGARGRRARDTAYGRCDRDHAARGYDRADDEQSRAGS